MQCKPPLGTNHRAKHSCGISFKHCLILSAAGGIILILSFGTALAGTTWDGGGTNTNWGTAANWDSDALPTFNSTTSLTFSTTGSTATLDTNRTVGSILINFLGYFTLNGSPTLTVYTKFKTSSPLGRSHTVSVPVNLPSTSTEFNVATADTLTLSNAISGPSGVAVTGMGVLRFTGVNTYTGKTTVQLGTLEISADSGLGGVPSAFVADQLKLSGTSGLGSGALRTSATFSLSPNRGINMVQTGVSGLFDVASGTTLTVPGVISGPGGLTTKASYSQGTLVLSGSNTYAGGTYIGSGGKLQLSGAGQLPSSTDLTVEGVFDLNGINQTVDALYLGYGWISLGGATLTVGKENGGSYFRGIIDGTGGLTKIGYGTQRLTGANSYTGATIVNAGALNIQHNQGTGTIAGGVTVANGAALQLEHSSGITVGAEALSLNGAGVSNSGALRNISGNNSWGGTISLAGDATIQSDAGSLTLNALNAVNALNQNLTLQGSGNGAISGTITSGAGALTKNGAGKWTLSALNTYSGATTIKGGTLEIAGGIDPAGTSLIDVQSGNASLMTVGVNKTDLNISTAAPATFEIVNGAHTVGAIGGNGTTKVDSGSLTAASISQNTLTIGSGATVSIQALPGGPQGSAIIAVPEPSVLILLGIGAISLASCAWRRGNPGTR
jgi:fibronectin-binding autotransporter adhesin